MKYIKFFWRIFWQAILMIIFGEWVFIWKYRINGIIPGLAVGLGLYLLWNISEWLLFPHTRTTKSAEEMDIQPVQNTKYLLKLFLFMTIFWGITMGICYSVNNGFKISTLIGTTFGAVVFGIYMTLFHKISVTNKLKKMGIKMFEGAIGVQHMRDIELKIPYDKTFELCTSSLSLIKKCNITSTEPSQGKIKAEIGKTHKNAIFFNIQKIDKNRTQVKVLGKSLATNTLFDGGLNLENVEKITQFLREKESSQDAY